MPSSIVLSDNGASSGSAGIKTSGGNDGLLLLQTTTSGGTATTAVTVDTNQNVGVGTTSPNSISNYTILQVGESASKQGYVETYDGTTRNVLWVNGGLGKVGTRTAHPLTFQINSSEVARLDTSGNLGLGVTPSAWKSTWKSMDIGTAASFYSQDNNTTGIGSNLYFNGSNWYRKNTGLAALYQLSDGGHYWYSNPTGAAGSTFTPAQLMTLNTSGVVALKGGNESATGTGIAFPATQSGSSDANTLDDYEEGTFTPVLTADGGSGWTYSTQVGRYTKIGNVVHVAYVLGLTAKGTMSGSFYLSGLPFTVEDVYSSAEPWGIAFSLVTGLSTNVVSLTGWANNASTLMQLRKQTAAAGGWGNSYLDVVDIASTFYIQCSCTYRT